MVTRSRRSSGDAGAACVDAPVVTADFPARPVSIGGGAGLPADPRGAPAANEHSLQSGADADLVHRLAETASVYASGAARLQEEIPVVITSSLSVHLRQLVRDCSIQRLDLRFATTSGEWRSFISPIADLDLGRCESAGGLPGRAVPWSLDLPALDPIVVPDFRAAFLDPFAAPRTLVVICNVYDSITRRSSALDCRSIAKAIESFVQSTHIAGSPRFRVEIAGVRAFASPADRFPYTSASHGDIGGRPAASGRADLGGPSEIAGCGPEAIMGALARAGVEIDDPRAFASGAPVKLAMSADSVWLAADKLMFCKYVIDRLGRREGGSTRAAGLGAASEGVDVRVTQSIWRKGRPLFAGDGYGGTAAIMRHYAAGLVAHAPALLEVLGMAGSARMPAGAAASPHGGCADDEFVASDHVSLSLQNPNAMSVTFALPRVPQNPYLALGAMVLAGVDGFNYRMYDVDPFHPLDEYFKRQASKRGPACDAGREFLFAGNLFTPELLSAAAAGREAGGRR